MTVVEDGVPVKSAYRVFRIKAKGGKSTADDIASLTEIVSRRLGHPEWPLPRAFIVDGGRTHKKAVEALLADAGVGIPVVAVVKDERHRPREVIGSLRAQISDADAVLANAEAHRFSITKHRAARSRRLRS
jgi:excinuclease ABC subunit C